VDSKRWIRHRGLRLATVLSETRFCGGRLATLAVRMHGYRVTVGHAAMKDVEASRYVVADDGALTLYGADEPVARWGPGEWLMIDEFGTRVSEQWPPSRLRYLVDEVATVLAVRYGHYVAGLRGADAFEDWRCNDVDSLTSAILEQVGLTAESTAEQAAVREAIGRQFNIASA
jgi:hypothetical protein